MVIKNDTHSMKRSGPENTEDPKDTASKVRKGGDSDPNQMQHRWCELRDKPERTQAQDMEMKLLEKKLEKLAEQNQDAFLERCPHNSLTAGHAASMRSLPKE